MENKKKLMIAGASALSLGILGVGAFAYFNDTVNVTGEAKVGSVDVDVNVAEAGALTHSSNLNNMNPGDNDPEVPTSYRSGTDHELTFEVENKGTKSVMTRTVLRVSGKRADGTTALTEDELKQIILSERVTASTAVGANDGDKYTQVTDATVLDGAVMVDGKLVYIVGGTDDTWVLNGVTVEGQATPETETGVTVSKQSRTFDIGLKKAVGSPDADGNVQFAGLEGATITIEVEVQGMQYRNTGDAEWEVLFTGEYNTATAN